MQNSGREIRKGLARGQEPDVLKCCFLDLDFETQERRKKANESGQLREFGSEKCLGKHRQIKDAVVRESGRG